MKYRFKTPFRWLRKPNINAPMTDTEGGTNVSERFNHYISRSIAGFYKRRMISPAIYLLILLALLLVSPTRSILFPRQLDGPIDPAALYQSRSHYVHIPLSQLRFTGYTRQMFGLTTGYYYYTIIDQKSYLVLLKPDTASQGLAQIDQVKVYAKIIKNPPSLDRIKIHLTEDLGESAGIAGALSPYMISEADARGILHRILVLFIRLTGIYAVISLLLDLLYVFFPKLSTPVRRLGAYGDPWKLLAEAEEELATMPQLAAEDMFITEHFFIETSVYGVAIVPISEIKWIYKYSTLHRILWHHFSISYTLYIMATHRQTIHCPKNAKSDIDGVIDYLSEANPDILVGFTERNRLRMQWYLRKLPLSDLIPFMRNRPLHHRKDHPGKEEAPEDTGN